jgi:ActR/RegA family two-component response regulator
MLPDSSLVKDAAELLDRDPQTLLVYDAREACVLAKHFGFTAAIVNLDLQGNEGLLLIQKVRKNFPALPVIVISGVLGEQ